eukprot:5745962-Prymnesium_polylepis.1
MNAEPRSKPQPRTHARCVPHQGARSKVDARTRPKSIHGVRCVLLPRGAALRDKEARQHVHVRARAQVYMGPKPRRRAGEALLPEAVQIRLYFVARSAKAYPGYVTRGEA